jgi:hypothetical protein
MYEAYTEGGNLRDLAQYIHNEPEKAYYIAQCNKCEQAYGESYHVIYSIYHHNRKTTNEDHPWANEFEIPIDIYERGITMAINVITDYRNMIGATFKARYDVLIQLLNELLAFRRENG